MTSFLVLYGLTLLIFIVADALVLPRLVLPRFQADLGETLASTFRYGPAAVFYLFFIGALLWLVTWPALRAATPLGLVAANAAIFGAAAYGTYEFTNLATIRGWTWRILVVDLAWGIVLTTGAASGGLALARLVI